MYFLEGKEGLLFIPVYTLFCFDLEVSLDDVFFYGGWGGGVMPLYNLFCFDLDLGNFSLYDVFFRGEGGFTIYPGLYFVLFRVGSFRRCIYCGGGGAFFYPVTHLLF